MRERKYTLPRHTNLAKQGARTGAFLIDLAVGLALSVALFFGCFNLIFKSQVKPCRDLVHKEEINSGLYVKDKNGEPQRISSSKDSDEFKDAIYYYYFCYLPGENIDKSKGLEACKEKRKKPTVEWFNKNILEIDPKNKDSVYKYKEVDGVPDKTQIGVKKVKSDGVTELEVEKFIQQKYVATIILDFNEISYIKETGYKAMMFNALSFTLASFIGFGVSYLVFPLVFKNGQTLGKKVFKLCLSNSDGYEFKNTQLIMRFMPFAVCDLSLLALVRANMYVVMTIYLIIFLVSFALAMASPKKMSLHDFTARTLVVDFSSSIIFKDPYEEEKYLLKEDNLLEDVDKNVEYAGEEPPLKYEK